MGNQIKATLLLMKLMNGNSYGVAFPIAPKLDATRFAISHYIAVTNDTHGLIRFSIGMFVSFHTFKATASLGAVS